MLIKGGKVYDPLNNIFGEIKDIYTADGKIVEKSMQDQVLDATGMIVMPGGVDIHSHIAGNTVHWGRTMCLNEHRDNVVAKTADTRCGVSSTVPSGIVTGYLYGRLGYTTVVNPGVAALEAKQVHRELSIT
jgi:formylmethanofuran dehydrogenase subunit A